MDVTSQGTLVYVCSSDGGGEGSFYGPGGDSGTTVGERRVLQAAVVEAHGRPGAYVTEDRVMRQANMVDTEHFRTVAKYLEASPGIFALRFKI